MENAGSALCLRVLIFGSKRVWKGCRHSGRNDRKVFVCRRFRGARVGVFLFMRGELASEGADSPEALTHSPRVDLLLDFSIWLCYSER